MLYPTPIAKLIDSYSKPVSYTHLDVYKRQGFPVRFARVGHCFAESFRPLSLLGTDSFTFPDCKSHLFGDSPVSYTHLDVYKRQEYKGGVNGAEAAVHEVPEYKGENNLVLAAADNKLSLGQDVTYQAPAAKQDELPNTGSKETSSLISLGLAGVLLSLFAFGKKRKE